MAKESFGKYQHYLRQRPVKLTLLSILAVVFFLVVTGLSRVHDAQRQALGNRWFNRGVTDLKAQHYKAAVQEFRAALLYSRDNYQYQFNLAEALIGTKNTGEASAYLMNLWDREPEDGLVNLELARIAAQRGQIEQAVRYYHDAVYAAWPSDKETTRRDARFELIELLLRTNAIPQAQIELLALAENVDDPSQQERIGDLFLKAQDYEHAMTAYRSSLRADRHNEPALAGAGYAAFQLGRYPAAEKYLQAAVAGSPKDTQSADLLNTTELVLHLDPYQRGISTAERNRRAIEAFEDAGQRLKSCAIPKATPGGSPTSLNEDWNSMKPRVTAAGLRRDPDLVDSAMDLTFRIERQASVACGSPTGKDLALLLIAKLHEGN